MTLCPTPTTILVADDHPLILRGLSDLIRGDPNLEVLATCTDGLTAFEQIRKYRPAIAVVDQNMPEMSGLDILMETKAAGLPTRVVLLTADIGDADIVSAVFGGVDGLVMKNAAPDTLVDCLREVASGRRWLPSYTVAVAIDRETERRNRACDLFRLLTHREREIVALASRGLSNKEIARSLGIAEGTAKIHLNSIYSKLNVASRASLLAAVGEYLDLLILKS
jgi:DNA-binding NarL/FixJ family response regulator